MAERWFIVDQNQTERLGRVGTFDKVMEVVFEVPGAAGGPFTVHIPLARYTPENVRLEIDEYVDRILGTAEL